jgi:predicted metalloprotease
MNERFEKLLVESFFDQVADQADAKVYKLNDAVMQKFAELIVRECAEVASEYDGAHYVGTAIQKHFGIEK